MNLAPKTQTVGVGTGAWPLMWGNGWDWDGWVKKQIDLCAGNGNGCNAVRIQGAAYALLNGTLGVSLQTYLDRWAQVFDYCKSIGMYVYPCAANVDLNFVWNGQSAPAIANLFAPILRHHQQYQNVLGCDLVQEMNGQISVGQWPALTAHFQAVIANLKANGVTLPITLSAGAVYNSGADSGETWLNAVAGFVDYLDAHLYFFDFSATLPERVFDSVLTAYPDKELIIGEGGVRYDWPTSSTDQVRLAYYRKFFAAARAHPRIRGALGWSAIDACPLDGAGVGVADSGWGLYSTRSADSLLSPRPHLLMAVREATGGSVASANGQI